MTFRPVAVDADGLPVPDPRFKEKQKAAAVAYFAGETETAPTMHATDPGWFRDLSARIPGLLVHSAGGALPFQSEGTLHGLPYYFRYRHGYVDLRVATTEDAVFFEPLYVAGMSYGDEHGGVLDRDEFCTLMVTLVPQLERAPFCWEFTGVNVNVENLAGEGEPKRLRFTATDTPETYRAWGATAVEAHARLHEPSSYLLAHGWTEVAQAQMHALQAIDPEPVNEDTRVFPDPEPEFQVRQTSTNREG